ncbi:hypothetical protein BGZ51_007459 [Haplosporangium sp. Z 767]|nr:hypothetical protein BGZ51_007459 [Haplosporangium sp. Z 767]KAF9180126.1 hypothetical protein BGZ50_006447 [Haplosporangium sp. Z 11]
MYLQSVVLLALLCTVVLARDDPAQLCTGALSCDAGFCCSRGGFCGRSALHCSHSSGCNGEKGSCGVVLLDRHDFPRVIPYKELDHRSVEDLIKKLKDEGLHVSPQESNNGSTIETTLEKGLTEKEHMLIITKPATPRVAQPPSNPIPLDNEKNKDSESNKDPVDKTSYANRITYSVGSAVGTVVLGLIL